MMIIRELRNQQQELEMQHLMLLKRMQQLILQQNKQLIVPLKELQLKKLVLQKEHQQQIHLKKKEKLMQLNQIMQLKQIQQRSSMITTKNILI